MMSWVSIYKRSYLQRSDAIATLPLTTTTTSTTPPAVQPPQPRSAKSIPCRLYTARTPLHSTVSRRCLSPGQMHLNRPVVLSIQGQGDTTGIGALKQLQGSWPMLLERSTGCAYAIPTKKVKKRNVGGTRNTEQSSASGSRSSGRWHLAGAALILKTTIASTIRIEAWGFSLGRCTA